jgi:hypothetical protein
MDIITSELLEEEKLYLTNDRERYLECLNNKLLSERKTPQEIRDGLILFGCVYKAIISRENNTNDSRRSNRVIKTYRKKSS